MEILHDPRVRSVEWRDLTQLSRWEIGRELLLSLPWLGLSLFFAAQRWVLPALAASFVLFLTGLRQAHNAQHYVLGLSHRATEWVLFVLSVLMQCSMHAIQVTHLQHHKHCMDDEDVEADSARMSGWQALLLGPLFPIRLHRKALQIGKPRQRAWIVAELVTNVVWIALVFGVIRWPPLQYHILAMLAGQCLTAFFAVWTVHHDCDRSHYIARTLRRPLVSLLAHDMFFHVEHHLYPRVPTCHLPLLAKRLDQAAPELKEKQVF